MAVTLRARFEERQEPHVGGLRLLRLIRTLIRVAHVVEQARIRFDERSRVLIERFVDLDRFGIIARLLIGRCKSDKRIGRVREVERRLKRIARAVPILVGHIGLTEQQPRARIGAHDFRQAFVVVDGFVEIVRFCGGLAEARKRFGIIAIGADGRRPLAHGPVHVFFGGQIIAVRDVRGRQAAVIVDRLTEGRVGVGVHLFARVGYRHLIGDVGLGRVVLHLREDQPVGCNRHLDVVLRRGEFGFAGQRFEVGRVDRERAVE